VSLKVWTAYRVKDPACFWPLTRDIQDKATERARGVIEGLCESMLPDVDTSREAYAKHLKSNNGDELLARLDTVSESLREGYRAAVTSPYKSYFDFDVSVTFREYEGQLYAIPYCSGAMSKVLGFLGKEPRLVDYHYQNQVDRDPTVPKSEWEERRKVWEPLSEDTLWKHYLVLETCSWSKWYDVLQPFKLRSKLYKKLSSKKS
jgi:hypothetical protein